MKDKKRYLLPGVLFLAFALFIVLLRTVDVAAIGPEGTSVGFSHLNAAVARLTGVHMIWYEITDYLGIAAILVACLFAALGLIQMLRRRSLLKVDRRLLALGALYAAMVVLYVLFEKAVVNCRPVIMPGELHPEASFPSSHTMLVCVFLGGAAMLLGDYVKNESALRALRLALIAAAALTVVGRLVSGVHWFTDILGGLLISAALLTLYGAVCGALREREDGAARR